MVKTQSCARSCATYVYVHVLYQTDRYVSKPVHGLIFPQSLIIKSSWIPDKQPDELEYRLFNNFIFTNNKIV